MPRTLRPRKSKPSYTALSGENSESEDQAAKSTAGTSKKPAVFEDDVESGSDFEPGKDNQLQEPGLDDEIEVDVSESDAEEDLGSKQPSLMAAPSTPPKRPKQQLGVSKPSLSSTTKRHAYALPTPSMHHRHRAIPLYTHMGRTERLEARPYLFNSWKATISNNPTRNFRVSDRVNKSWSFNVGSGPLWEMVEDRGWYKEAAQQGTDMQVEINRRPKVYQNLPVMNGWEILTEIEAAPYLPTDTMTTEDGTLRPSPPVTCFLGKIEQQVEKKFEMFQALKMSEVIPESPAYLFNAGAPVWGLDWCPINPGDRESLSYKQYLAVAPFPTRSHSPEIGARVARPSHACIQIWSFSPSEREVPPNQQAKDNGEVMCEMVLCLEGGPAHDLKWCPLPAHDNWPSSVVPRKLGLLGGVFEDGSWSVYAVPDPTDISQAGRNPDQPVYLRLPEPLLRIELEETACCAFDWANSELIGIGTTNGIIAVYNIGPKLMAIDTPDHRVLTDLLPTHYITVHQSAIRALAWIRAPAVTSAGTPRIDADPTVIVSGGYDGMECLTDIREGHGSILNRTRDVINAMAFSPFGGGPVTIDHENIVKAYSASPTMLGRGHTLLDPHGPVWSIHASDFHPQLAVGAADGSCITTNCLRSTRRGGSVPFFIHKVYQLDYSRNTGVYRMLEQFYPQETQDRPAAKANAAKGTTSKKDPKKKGRIKADGFGTGAWPREVGVHRVVWNSCCGLGAAGLLASATASGLCRIDVLWGRWVNDKIPYGGVEQIWREFDEDNAMDVDRESDDSIEST